MRNFLSSTEIVRASSLWGGRWGSGPPAMMDGTVIWRGELPALLFPGLALLGSELAGVGCSRAERLALLLGGATLGFISECDERGGDTDRALWGGVRAGPPGEGGGRGPGGVRGAGGGGGGGGVI